MEFSKVKIMRHIVQNVSIISACSMPLLCDIAMIFIHFHTLLIIFGLTYYSSAPQCQFLFSAVFVFQVFTFRELPRKIQKNYIKNQRSGNNTASEGQPGGAQGLQAPCGRPLPLGRAGGAPGPP